MGKLIAATVGTVGKGVYKFSDYFVNVEEFIDKVVCGN